MNPNKGKQAKVMVIGHGPDKVPHEIGVWYSEQEYDKLSTEIEQLKKQLANPLNEYICKKCGLRQNNNNEEPTF